MDFAEGQDIVWPAASCRAIAPDGIHSRISLGLEEPCFDFV